MKTFNKDQKVTHIEWGKGIVKRLRNNDTEGWIDFGGHGQWFHATDKSIQRGVNECVEKPTAHGVLAKVQKLQEKQYKRLKNIDQYTSLSDKMLVDRKRTIDFINDLENILQGEK